MTHTKIKPMVGLVESHDIIEGWVLSCIHEQQLALLMDVINDLITSERYPDEDREAINLASISLHITLDLKLRDLRKQYASRQN